MENFDYANPEEQAEGDTGAESDVDLKPHEKLMHFLGDPSAPVMNIVDQLDPNEVDKVGLAVFEGYELDKQSRFDWEKNTEQAMKLAMQIAEPKNFPFDGAANVKYPLLTESAIQFQARAYPAIVSGQNVVKGQVSGPDPENKKKEIAKRIGEHMSWQLLNEMDDWDEETDRMMLILAIVGNTYRKTFFSGSTGKNVSEMVMAQHLVYSHTTPWAKLRRKTQEIFLYTNDIQERIRAGLFTDIETGIPDEPNGDKEGSYDFLECHCWYDFDGDGYQEPYIVTVQKRTKKVFRIVPRFDFESILMNSKDEVQKINEIEYFTKFMFIPNPDGGSYDIGLGFLLNPISSTLNTILNQFIDSGTLANAGGGFIGNGLRMKGGRVRMKVGEYVPIDAPGKDIAQNIVSMKFPGPTPVMMELIQFLINAGKDISSVKDILTGDTPSNTTATATMAMIEQGQKVFTAIYKRIHRALGEEFRKLYRLNKLYLKPESYYRFEDQVNPILLQDYQGDGTDVAPVSDPTMATDAQKMGKAEALMKFNGDPLVDQIELRKRYFAALQVETPDKLLKPPPPPPGPSPEQMADLAEAHRKKAETDAKIEQMRVQNAKIEADSILALAQASAQQVQTRLDIFEQHLQVLLSGMNGVANGTGSVQGMATPPADSNSASVPTGLPPMADGAMGGGSLQSGQSGGDGNEAGGSDIQGAVLP